MMYTKDYLGSFVLGGEEMQYFVIHKTSSYGISVEQSGDKERLCQIVWFTEEKETAYSLANKMLLNEVSLMHIEEIIDDFVQ